jgi:hypothetical protein
VKLVRKHEPHMEIKITNGVWVESGGLSLPVSDKTALEMFKQFALQYPKTPM